MERERYLLELARYVVLIPVRAGMVGAPGAWPWSSYRATVGEEIPVPAFLETDWVLRAFAEGRAEAVAGYRRFVAEGIGDAGPWSGLKGQIYMGSEQFVERMQALIDPRRPLREIPMTNHYHLLLETPDANLSKGMRQLNGVYTQYVNRAHGRVGHLFQGRFKAILVERERYLLELARYVVLNPVRAGMVRAPGDWPWSSYRATVGEEGSVPAFLETDWLLRAFAERRVEAVAGYRRFVAEGIGAAGPWSGLKGQIYLGSEQFVERMQALIDPKRPLREIPKRQRRALAKPLDDYASSCPDRDSAIVEAFRSGAYSMQAIAEHFGVSRMTVSRTMRRHEGVVGDLALPF
ncbi:transposase [Thiocapsa bogorovii]|uniref:transposase n=1 Tax=Thiocapsa bogorovii TaxID=521689 RepID=UPI001E4ECBBD|nr:transposase [Thiocapsa bogorovii]UHD17821.1 transposase [Thiocapsa bogorovii]